MAQPATPERGHRCDRWRDHGLAAVVVFIVVAVLVTLARRGQP
jgi:hypothetical protein